jgi:imidazolonepropionase-like amidohydrolase
VEIAPQKTLPTRGRSFKRILKLWARCKKAGVGILAGTDTLNPYCFPGFSLHDELGFLVQAGLTPMEALQAATVNPARFLGKEKEMGTVEVGKIADLVLLDANPLVEIRNTTKIAAVVFEGKLFSRTSLDAMLQQRRSLGEQEVHRRSACQNDKRKRRPICDQAISRIASYAFRCV